MKPAALYRPSKKGQVLSKEEIINIVKRVQKGPGKMKAKEELVLAMSGLVHHTVKRLRDIHSTISSYDDLYQEGQIGVLRAVETFDIDTGYSFSTYASHWIQHKIKKFAKDQSDAPARIPIYVIDINTRYDKLKREVPGQEEKWYVATLVKRMRYSKSAVKEALVLRRSKVELDNVEVYQNMKDKIYSPEFNLDGLDYRALLALLNDDEREIVERWCNGEFLEHIARERGLTRERMRQLRELALNKLRGKVKLDGEIYWQGKRQAQSRELELAY